MKRTYITLVFALVCGFGIFCVTCERQKPGDDEIEIVINKTESKIWKCPECPFGHEPNVKCGASVNSSVHIQCIECVEGHTFSDSHGYAPCKNCHKCEENEERSGSCSKEEDTTKCLGTCLKGFYWESASCQPCSNCCGENYQHEKQCENAGVPTNQQCQQTVECQHAPTNASHLGDKQRQGDQNDSQRKSLSTLEVVALGIVSAVLIVTAFLIMALLVMWRLHGWQETKHILKRYFCSCCPSAISNDEVAGQFDNEVFDPGNFEPTTWREYEMQKEEETDQMGPLKSVSQSAGKRPAFQRSVSSSVPAKSLLKVESVIPRSRSHPGCLGKLGKEQVTENKPAAVPKKTPRKWMRSKKLEKNGYVAVPTDPDPPDVTFEGTADMPREKKPTNPRSFFVGQQHQSISTTGLDYTQHTTTTVASVPEHFQSNLLKGKMEKIPIKFYSKICVKLDKLRDCFWDDYRLFGEAIGLDKDVVTCLGQIGNPTCQMLEKFDSQEGSSIRKFRDLVKKMGRDDVVSILEDWIVDEWIKSSYSLSSM